MERMRSNLKPTERVVSKAATLADYQKRRRFLPISVVEIPRAYERRIQRVKLYRSIRHKISVNSR